jgi:nitroreductase
MLALRAEGFDSCPMEGFDARRASKLLGLQGGEEVSMFIAVGKRAADGIRYDRALLPRAWTVQSL